MGTVIDLVAVRGERAKRMRQAEVAVAVAFDVVAALSAGEGAEWLREKGAAEALGDLVAERLRLERPDLFGDEIEGAA